MIERAAWACAATFRPALPASCTAARTSSSVNSGICGTPPSARKAPEAITLIRSIRCAIPSRTTRRIPVTPVVTPNLKCSGRRSSGAKAFNSPPPPGMVR